MGGYSGYVSRLGHQPGVQLSPVADAVAELARMDIADRVVAVVARTCRGRIDRPVVVDRATARRMLGKEESNLVRPVHEARMQVTEMLGAGAEAVVVSRLVPAAARKLYASFDFAPTVAAVVESVTIEPAVNEGDAIVAAVTMDSASGAQGVPFMIYGLDQVDGPYGVSPEDISSISFSDGVTQSGASINVPYGVSEFTITIHADEDLLTEGDEYFYLEVGGIESSPSLISDTSLTPIVVSSVDGPLSVDEGDDAVFTVQMSGSRGLSGVSFSLQGVSEADVYVISFSDGVTSSGGLSGILDVPVGVTSFTATVGIVADLSTEGVEFMTLLIGGQSATATVNDTSLTLETPIALGSALWLDATDSQAITYNAQTGEIVQWSDKSGNGRHADRQEDWAAGPSYFTTTRFESGAVFLGRGSFTLDGSPLPATGNQSYFVVLYVANYSSNTDVLYLLGQVHTQISFISGVSASRMTVSALYTNPNSARSVSTNNTGVGNLDPITPGSKHILSFVSPGSYVDSKFRVGDVVQPKIADPEATRAPGQVYAHVGGNSNSPWRDFHVAEMVYFNKTLTDEEVASMNQYLSAKHGL